MDKDGEYYCIWCARLIFGEKSGDDYVFTHDDAVDHPDDAYFGFCGLLH